MAHYHTQRARSSGVLRELNAHLCAAGSPLRQPWGTSAARCPPHTGLLGCLWAWRGEQVGATSLAKVPAVTLPWNLTALPCLCMEVVWDPFTHQPLRGSWEHLGRFDFWKMFKIKEVLHLPVVFISTDGQAWVFNDIKTSQHSKGA